MFDQTCLPQTCIYAKGENFASIQNKYAAQATGRCAWIKPLIFWGAKDGS